ncbi:PAS domain S-box-containing protein [Desulfobacula phenolica]|uniref:PAS domain S-box-containing protein n=2 Tax=Desulfobacula phenolica TaxID=90732 RepID=A0A1H2JM46_9BACT|nr:PAS domain S-box-containing protein [Desulfobacula phenolica]
MDDPMISTKYPIWNHSGDGKINLDWKEFGNSLLNATPNGIAVFSKSFQTIISNKIARNSLDIYPGALLDTTIPPLQAAIRKVLETKQALLNIVIKKKGNSFSAMLNPIFHNNELIGILAVFEDMTTIEKISSEMVSFQQLSIELDTIIDSSNDGLFICDGNGVILRINPASERMTRITSKKFVGKNIRELVKRKIIDKSVTLEVLKTRKKVNLIQETKDGKQLFLTGNPVFDPNGNLFRVVVNERDITDIIKLKQELEEKAQLTAQYKRDLLEKQIEETESRHIIAKSSNYVKIIQKAIKLAEVDSTVLVLGESGTGKGVITDLIHKYSTRAGHPMIKINCGSIPDSLVESELFGYAKGAFTGARQKGKPGKFELADKGIIFLDEIAELPLGSQVKLLKFIEDGVISRVGGTDSKKVDVRIIAATNRDLKKMIEKKQFRSDLYYRLNVVPLKIPPLRKRKECLVPLIDHYLNLFCKKYKKKKMALSSEAVDALVAYPYPGNVREMINICERLVVMSQNSNIEYKNLPGSVQRKTEAGTPVIEGWNQGQTLQQMVDELEKTVLETVLKNCRTQANAAKILGLNQSTIARKLKKHNLA